MAAHLTPLAAALLYEPPDRRIRAILGERWVLYPRAKQALGVLNRLVTLPRTTRMPSVAIYGDSGMGKTMLMERFCSDHPARFDPEAGVERTPVLALQMAGKPGERRLYVQLLAALGLPPPGSRASVVDLEQSALRLMRAIGVQVLVIDEVHNILAGSQREQRVVLNTLRYLSNELKLSLVCFRVRRRARPSAATCSLPATSTSSRSGDGRRMPSSRRSSGPSCGTCPFASRAR